MRRLWIRALVGLLLLVAGLWMWRPSPRDPVADLGSPDPEVVMAASQQLWMKAHQGVDVGPDLVRGLAHPAARARSLSISSLVRLDMKNHADDIAALLADRDVAVRIQAAKALRELGGWTNPGPLLRGLQDRSLDERVRVDLAWALGNRRDSSAEGPLARLAADATEPLNLRQEALEALGALAPADRIPFLVRFLDGQEQPLNLRLASARALGRMADPAAGEALRLAASRRQDADLVRAEAAASLANHGREQDRAALRALAEAADQPLVVRLGAAQALVTMGQPPAELTDLVRQGLAHPWPGLRADAACLAGSARIPELSEDLRAAMERETSRRVRGELRAALRSLRVDERMDPDSGLAP